MAAIVLHLPQHDDALSGWHLRLYRVIRDMAAREGIVCRIRPRDPALTPASRGAEGYDDGDLHIIDDRSVQGAGVLNAAVAYFWEFWHLDPVGTKALSSIGALEYDPREMPYARAKVFFANLRKALVERRLSKYDQPRGHETLPQGALAVFLQGDFPMRQGVTAFDDLAMLRAVMAGAGDRPIVVKPHPLASDLTTLAAAEAMADERVRFTTANVHDILAACAATVSINSTVALEGFLHRKPAILFGESDFHHYTSRVHQADDFANVLDAELQRDGGYAQYLAWYFLRHCLRIGSPDLEPAIWARFAAAGFPRERF